MADPIRVQPIRGLVFGGKWLEFIFLSQVKVMATLVFSIIKFSTVSGQKKVKKVPDDQKSHDKNYIIVLLSDDQPPSNNEKSSSVW